MGGFIYMDCIPYLQFSPTTSKLHTSYKANPKLYHSVFILKGYQIKLKIKHTNLMYNCTKISNHIFGSIWQNQRKYILQQKNVVAGKNLPYRFHKPSKKQTALIGDILHPPMFNFPVQSNWEKN